MVKIMQFDKNILFKFSWVRSGNIDFNSKILTFEFNKKNIH